MAVSFAACRDENVTEETTTEPAVTQAPKEYQDERFKYRIYSDHVEIFEYVGKDTTVFLPAELDNKPVTSFGQTFNGNMVVTRVEIPHSYTEIEADAFYNCLKLASVTINKGNLKSIGANAFFGCQNLKFAEIPATVTDIDDDAFKYCTDLVITGEKGSAAEDFVSKFASIYFREKQTSTTAPVTVPEETTLQ